MCTYNVYVCMHNYITYSYKTNLKFIYNKYIINISILYIPNIKYCFIVGQVFIKLTNLLMWLYTATLNLSKIRDQYTYCKIISLLNTEKIQADTELENYTVKLFHNTSLFRPPMGLACCKSLKKSLYLRVNSTLRALRITGGPDLYDFLSINVFNEKYPALLILFGTQVTSH